MTIETYVATVGQQPVFAPTARHASRILVVEDDPELRRLVTETLEEEGFQTHGAPDALTGIISLLSDGADVVLTEWKMPGFDGLRLLESTRRLAPGTPVVLVTAYAEPALREIIRQCGEVSLLQKPFRRDELVFHVERALRRAGHVQA
jgi:DNA-binding response OmpR family regulator